jgi:AcrR family transcriptional regulator
MEQGETSAADLDARERILDAARNAFRERGTHGARMQEIADAAGVNKALLHYYFRNKETLAAGVFTRELQHLVRPVFGTLGSERSLEEKVRTVVGLYLDTLSTMPGLPAYVLSEIHYHPDRLPDFLGEVAGADPRGRAHRAFEAIGRQIEEEVTAGRMRPIRPEEFVMNLVSLCVFPFAAAPLFGFLLGGEVSLEDLLAHRRETLPAFFLRGLRP